MHEREVKLTRLTCVWLYDVTGGKVAAVSGINERKSFMH